jgi:hypothetical protein
VENPMPLFRAHADRSTEIYPKKSGVLLGAKPPMAVLRARADRSTDFYL